MLITRNNIQEVNFEVGSVILIDKPLGFTSYAVVDKIKRLLKTRTNQKIKIGHAGTLDPLATGLLILCTGKMTKSIQKFQEMEKTYSGSIELGSSTPSYDLETEINLTLPIHEIDEQKIEATRKTFLGYQEIIPPIHSAVKVNGKRSYQLARKGETPILLAKPIYISEFAISHINLPVFQFRISCTKGTYIRSIAYEFGKRLNNVAYLKSLCRESIGEYNVQQSFSLTELETLLANQ